MKKTKYISVKEYTENKFNRRGYPISESYIYRIIREFKDKKRDSLPFDFEEIGQIIRIKQ